MNTDIIEQIVWGLGYGAIYCAYYYPDYQQMELHAYIKTALAYND